MSSKQVTDRQKSAQAVIFAATTHAPRVGKSTKDMLSPMLKKNQEPADVEALMLHLAGWLERAKDEMVRTDEAHSHELADDAEPRARRDETKAELSEELVSLRNLVAGVYGAKVTKELGFSTETPSDPVVLWRFAGEVSKALRKKSALPPPQRGKTKVTWSPAETADQIDEIRERLDAANKDVAREAREAQGTLADRNKALETYDDVFRRVANLLVGLFMFAGETELADKVRPSARRAGQTEELAPPAEETKPATPGGDK
ncbi:MAG: hypothetical protein U0441_09520 [Polyangiaceae bacterium]